MYVDDTGHLNKEDLFGDLKALADAAARIEQKLHDLEGYIRSLELDSKKLKSGEKTRDKWEKSLVKSVNKRPLSPKRVRRLLLAAGIDEERANQLLMDA